MSPTTTSKPILLDHRRNQIRLLAFDGLRKIRLRTFELASCPPFIALSYTWGSTEEPFELYVDNQKIRARTNLIRALDAIYQNLTAGNPVSYGRIQPSITPANYDQSKRHSSSFIYTYMEERSQWKYFWIDAICINQSDNNEKSHQVQLMSRIYSSALFVMVWLDLPEQTFQRLTDTRNREATGRALDEFVAHDYWDRIWTIQEFLLARDIGFLSPSGIFPWKKLENSVRFLERDVQDEVKEVTSWRYEYRLWTMRWRLHPEEADTTLDDLICRFKRHKCSDARDLVYGLLSLVKDPNDNLQDLRPDYSSPTAKLLKKLLSRKIDVPPVLRRAALVHKTGSAKDIFFIETSTIRVSKEHRHRRTFRKNYKYFGAIFLAEAAGGDFRQDLDGRPYFTEFDGRPRY